MSRVSAFIDIIIQQLGSDLVRLLRLGLYLLAALILLGLISQAFAHSMRFFLQVLAFASMALFLLSSALMVLTFRKSSLVRPGALVLSIAISITVLLVQLLIAQQTPADMPSLLSFMAGVLIGTGWSKTRLFFIDQQQIKCQGTSWYLLIWATTLALNQFMATLAAGVPTAMLVLLLMGSGLATGSSLEQLVRYWRVSQSLFPQSQQHGATS